MCLGRVWNKRFPFDLSASSIAVTMFFISTARAEANCSALIALGTWEVTTGVEELVGAKPGILLFLFLFRPLLCFSALVPVFEDAILVPEAANNQHSGFVYFIVRSCFRMWLKIAQPCFRSVSLRFSVNWMFTCKFRIFYFCLLVYGFLLLSCVGGNEMSVIAKATAKHTASVSCLSIKNQMCLYKIQSFKLFIY